jgi:hypothetical protein
MATCKLESLTDAANGHGDNRIQCVTHEWTFEGMPSVPCPIGAIEESAERTIKAISDAAEVAIARMRTLTPKHDPEAEADLQAEQGFPAHD